MVRAPTFPSSVHKIYYFNIKHRCYAIKPMSSLMPLHTRGCDDARQGCETHTTTWSVVLCCAAMWVPDWLL